MLSVLVALQLLGGAPAGRPAELHVPVAGDAALPCAANEALRAAIRLRLPTVRLTDTRAEADDLTAGLRRGGAGWSFEVRRASGAVAMSRALADQPDCAQLADTSALILERYLAEIAWRGRPVEIAALAQPHERTNPQPTTPEQTNPVQPERSRGRPDQPTPPERNPVQPERSRGRPDPPMTPAALDSAGPRSGAAERLTDLRRPVLDETPVPPPPPPAELRTDGVSGVHITPGTTGVATSDRALPTHATLVETPPAPVAKTPVAEKPAPPPDAGVLLASLAPPEPPAEPSNELHAPPLAPGPAVFSRWSVSAGGGGWLGLPTALTAQLAVELATHLLDRVRLSLLLFGANASSRAIAGRGTLSAQSFLGVLTGTLCVGERPSFCGGAAAGARLTTGSVSTPSTGARLYRTDAGVLALPVAGLYGRLALPLGSHLELSFDLCALAPLGSANFAIEGFGPLYTTPPVDLVAALRLGWRFF